MGSNIDSATWRKSSYSGSNGGDCVEVATLADGIAVRDSKDPAGAVLTFSPAAWGTFTAAVKSGEPGRLP
jgi:hypothetical protein